MGKKKLKLNDDDPLGLRLKAVGVREILFEIHQVGTSARVSAIDPRSGTEVTTVCPAGHDESAMQRVAAGKLAYVLEKKRRLIEGDGSIVT